MSNDSQIEQDIQAKGLAVPCVTHADVEAYIAEEYFFTAEQGADAASGGRGAAPLTVRTRADLSMTMFCVLVLRNGRRITGVAHCSNLALFNAQAARKKARAAAIGQLWPVVRYAKRLR